MRLGSGGLPPCFSSRRFSTTGRCVICRHWRQSLGLDVLLEVHDEAELARALAVEGAVIGVNNRDLRTFAVSLETTDRLAGLVPAGRLLVSESGIRDHADVVKLAPWVSMAFWWGRVSCGNRTWAWPYAP